MIFDRVDFCFSSLLGFNCEFFGLFPLTACTLMFLPAKMGSQVLVPFRGCEDDPRHLKLMGDLGQV